MKHFKVSLIPFLFLHSTQSSAAAPLPPDEAAVVANARACVEAKVREFDDRISSADVVAGAVLDSCQNTVRGKLPRKYLQEQGYLSRLQKYAVQTVLKSRAANQRQSAIQAIAPGASFVIGDVIKPELLVGFQDGGDGTYERKSVSEYLLITLASSEAGRNTLIGKGHSLAMKSSADCVARLKYAIGARQEAGFQIENLSTEKLIKEGVDNPVAAGIRFSSGDHSGTISCIRTEGRIFLNTREGLQRALTTRFKSNLEAILDAYEEEKKKSP